MQFTHILFKEFVFIKQIPTINKFFLFFLFLWFISFPVKNSIYQVSTVFLIIILIIDLFKNGFSLFIEILKIYKDILIGLSLVLFAMLISNLTNSETNGESYSHIIKYLYKHILLFFIFIYFYKKNFFSLNLVIVFIVLGGLFYSSHGLYDYIINNKIDIQSFLHNRNTFGLLMFFSTITIFTFIMNNYNNKILVTCGLIVFSLFIYCLFFSFSRSSWFASFIYIFLFFLLDRNMLNKKIILLIFIFLISIVFLFYFNDSLLGRLNQLITMDSSRRTDIWLDAIELIKQKIIFGYGFVDYSTIGWNGIHGAHNSLIEVFVYTGLFGFICFTYLLLLILKDIIKNNNYIYLPLFISLLLITQFDFSIYKGKVILAILTISAFIMLSHRVKKLESN